MSDNVFKFPKNGKEMDVDVNLEEDIAHSEVIHAVQQIMHINCVGMVKSIDGLTWEHIFDATFGMLIDAAFNAEIEPEELMEMLHSVVVEEKKYDA